MSMGVLFVLTRLLIMGNSPVPLTYISAAFTAIMKCLKLPAVYHESDDPTCKLSTAGFLSRQAGKKRNLTNNISPSDYTSELVLWRTAEAATTIMAASIPVLRVLFRDVASPSNRFYASYRRRMRDRHGTDRPSRGRTVGAANASVTASLHSEPNMLYATGETAQRDVSGPGTTSFQGGNKAGGSTAMVHSSAASFVSVRIEDAGEVKSNSQKGAQNV